MKPTRSANRTLTRRRSVVASAAPARRSTAIGSPRTSAAAVGSGGSGARARPPRCPRAAPAAPAALAAPGVAPAGRRTRRRTSCPAGSGSRSSGSPTRGGCRTRRRTSCRPGSRAAGGTGHAHSLEVGGGASVADAGRRAKVVITPRSPGRPVRDGHVGHVGREPRHQVPRREVDVDAAGPAADRDAVVRKIAASAMTGHARLAPKGVIAPRS